MTGLLILVGHYLRYHRGKTAIMVLSIALTIFLPVTIYRLVNEYQVRLMDRARSTPIVIGPRSNRFDLAFHCLYFRLSTPAGLTMAAVDDVRESGLAQPIPLHGMFTARHFPVVGTGVEYFTFRRLALAQGDYFLMLGDCVLGASVARELQLAPGERLMTDPTNVFDIAGEYPLNMHVRGVLQESATADDNAIFVDVKTAWVIQGLGHGHQDVSRITDEGIILDRQPNQVVAGAALMHYMEITPENIDSFHFHGELRNFPLTGMICIPRDAKSATILAGRYRDPASTLQLFQPVDVVEELFRYVFRIKRFFDVNLWLISLSTAGLLLLVVMLSQRLRQREMTTMFYLGCNRGTIWKLQACELAVVFAAALVLAGVAMQVTMAVAPWYMSTLLAVPC